MGAYIKWFESRFYRDSVVRGATLTISLISLVFVFSHIVTLYIEYMENIYIKDHSLLNYWFNYYLYKDVA